jgi:hypothetical protein
LDQFNGSEVCHQGGNPLPKESSVMVAPTPLNLQVMSRVSFTHKTTSVQLQPFKRLNQDQAPRLVHIALPRVIRKSVIAQEGAAKSAADYLVDVDNSEQTTV